MDRVSVPVTPRLREARAHPEYLGLERRASQARVYSRLAEIGWDAVQRARAHRMEYEAYVRAAQDPEHRAAVRALARLSREDGVI